VFKGVQGEPGTKNGDCFGAFLLMVVGSLTCYSPYNLVGIALTTLVGQIDT